MRDQGSASSTSDQLESLIRRVRFFANLDRVEIARLVGVFEPLSLPAGTEVFLEGADADALYLLENGQVSVTVQTPDGERSIANLEGPTHFGELGLLLSRRTASVRAVTDVQTWKLSRDRFEQLARDRPSLSLHVARALAEILDRRSREHVGAPVRSYAPTPLAQSTPRARPWRLLGGVLAVGIPALLWSLPAPAPLSSNAWHVLVVILGAAIGWLFEPVPDFVIALLMVTAWGVAGLAPLSSTFSGFANSAWAVTLGALGIAAAMAQSGLLFRITLWLVKTFRPTHIGQVLGLLVSGLLITPLVPMSTARVVAIAPIALEIGQSLGYPPRSRAMASLSFAGITGYGYFSSVFLTGLATNFFVLGLFPPEARVRFSWLAWLAAAAPAGLIMLVGTASVLLLFFRPEIPPRVTVELLDRQRRVLGPVTRVELGTLLALGVLIAGLIIEPLIHLPVEWLAIGALVLAFAGGGLDRERFRTSIDWGLLILFGIFFGTGEVLRRYGLDRWIASSLTILSQGATDPGLMVLFMALFVVVVRLAVPRIPAQLLLSLAFVPAASALGISPWVAGFVVLNVSWCWIAPAQGLEYVITRELTKREAFTDRQGLEIGVGLTVVRLLAIAASIPYWRAIGLLSR